MTHSKYNIIINFQVEWKEIVMKKLTLHDFQEIRLWMYRNARQIELALWQYYFENGSKEAVLSALSFYQNKDGGFGNALEADSWNPNSSPYTTLRAINKLEGIEYEDTQHSIIKGIFSFLESSTYCSDSGWFFSIPSNDHYAHAPWWTYDKEANEYEGIGVTAEIAAYILRYADKASELYNRVLSYTDIIIKKLSIIDKHGEMGIRGYCVLFDSIRQENLTCFDWDCLEVKLKELVNNTIERDTAKWPYYSTRPSKYISSPASIFYKDNKDIVSKELDYIIETRPKKGVWDITWSWFENNDKYSNEFAISQNWWKGTIAIHNMNLLRSFNRIDKEVDLS